MFDHFAFSVVIAPLLVLAGTWVIAERMRPEPAARVFAWSALVVSVASAVNLVAFTLKALAELHWVAGIGSWSAAIVRADTAHVPWVTGLATVWTAVGLAAVVVGRSRYQSSLRAAWAAVDGLPGEAEITIIADDRVEAFAVPARSGRTGRVVVTSGMRRAVDDRQLSAVVAHERAHLAGGHHRLTWMVRLAALGQPLLWPMVAKVEYLVERAADEAAAHEVGDRDDVARALGRAAVAVLDAEEDRAGQRRRHQGLLAMGYPPSMVPRRMAALAAPAARRRWLLALPLGIATGTVVWTFECAYDLHELLVHAGM
ncbi:hypothetical protein CcI49_03845 [Frankia sp. CcI49]|uniref:M56 family metallopeptidase n=1 Tax=unclassified Frankia TaxID=2632575 RepID=UPI0006C9E81B|nr:MULTISPECIES: M56 family metallopeptidase [unclassified Frankia]KPM53984.1 hypothetical protein ACG83_18095 [Frankia sp. R43]ONH61933.1 hypothetical protein CcI49_03845 [Frankia sp. CcI49]